MSNEDLKPQVPAREGDPDRQPSDGRSDRNASGRRWTIYGAIGLLLLCAPVALLAAIQPVNKYTAFEPGQIGMIDCDGPIGVLILAVPALIVCFGIAVALRMSSAFRGRLALIVVLIALAMAVSVIPNTVQAVIEMSGSDHRDVCG
jgi:hypothetical protein